MIRKYNVAICDCGHAIRHHGMNQGCDVRGCGCPNTAVYLKQKSIESRKVPACWICSETEGELIEYFGKRYHLGCFQEASGASSVEEFEACFSGKLDLAEYKRHNGWYNLYTRAFIYTINQSTMYQGYDNNEFIIASKYLSKFVRYVRNRPGSLSETAICPNDESDLATYRVICLELGEQFDGMFPKMLEYIRPKDTRSVARCFVLMRVFDLNNWDNLWNGRYLARPMSQQSINTKVRRSESWTAEQINGLPYIFRPTFEPMVLDIFKKVCEKRLMNSLTCTPEQLGVK